MEYDKIIEKLIGEIRPVGETRTDNARFDNLREMCNMVNKLVSKIDSVAYDFKDSKEFSVKRASDFASNFLSKTLGISE